MRETPAAAGGDRLAEFQRNVDEHVAAMKDKYGAQRPVVEQTIRNLGYDPEELGGILAVAGLSGTPGTNGAPDRVFATHRDVLQAVASVVGLDVTEVK
jgi:hypothetical protein